MIELSLGIAGLGPRETMALASTCAVSRAQGRPVSYSLHDWAASTEEPDLWVADGDDPSFRLQGAGGSAQGHFEGRAVWIAKAPWPTSDLVLRRPISWPLLLNALDGLAASKGFIERKAAPTLRPSEPVRRALFLGSNPALLLQLEAGLLPQNIYLIPAADDEIASQLCALSRFSFAFIEHEAEGLDLARACRSVLRDTTHKQVPRIVLLASVEAIPPRRKMELLGVDEVLPLPLQLSRLHGLLQKKVGPATSSDLRARPVTG